MALVRSEITTQCSDDLPIDYCTNTVYHTIADSLLVDPAVGYQSHCDEIIALFTGNDPTYNLFNVYQTRKMTVNVYDMADPLPRPERATHVYNPSGVSDSTALGPRQVALVLSYYGTRNLKRQRGHIYLGPFNHGDVAAVRPDVTLQAKLIDLGHGLFNIGGENVAHVVHSTVGGTNTVVQNYWCDDSWDTQRRRKDKATHRSVLAP